MLRIENLVFDAWGRRFFDGASVAIPVRGQSRSRRPQRRRQINLVQAHYRATGGAGRRDHRCPRHARIGSVDQEHPATPVTLIDTILAADTRRETAQRRTGDCRAPEELAEIYQRLNAIDADRAPAKAAEILSGLGFSNDDLARPMAEFSGGWRMRVALAAALVCRARCSLARRADQLPRSRGRAVARSAAAEISEHRADHQPRPRAT